MRWNVDKRKHGSVALTQTIVDQLKPRSKPYDVRDARTSGFYVRVQTSGRKTYRYEYRRGKHYTVGRAGAGYLRLGKAREIVEQVMGEAAKGVDPNAVKKEQRVQERQIANQFTFSEFLKQKYEPWYKVTYPKTADATIQVLEQNFKAVFGHTLLSDITLEKVEHWRSKQQLDRQRVRLKSGKNQSVPVKPATLNRYIERFSAMLSKAVEYGCIEKNPILGIKKLKVAEANRVRFLSQVEYRKLLDALNAREVERRQQRDKANAWRKERHRPLYSDLNKQVFTDHLKPMVLLALGSGVRFGSLIKLEWEKHVDITKDGVILKLTPDIVKTEKGYEVPLDETTSKVVKDWYQQTYETHKGKGWVFPGKKPGGHITSVKNSWKKLLEKAGIEDFHWHDIRHDYASQHVMSGTDLYTVMELLGHTDPKMTNKYAHLASEHKIEAAKKLAQRRERLLKKKE